LLRARWGFVWFNDQQSADSAIREMDGAFWNGRRLQVAPRQKRSASNRPTSTPSTSLYIGNIPYETTDAALNDIFRDLNGVKDVRVAVDRTTGWPRGFAHADFETIEAAGQALEKLRDMTIGDRSLRVDYAGRARAGSGSSFRTER
jgi:nucleolin